MGRLLRRPLTIFEPVRVGRRQKLSCDYLAYCDLPTDCQRCSYAIVREHHALTVSHLNHRIPPFPKCDARLHNLSAAVGRGCVIRLPPSASVKARTDAKVLKAKRPLNWTDQCKFFAVDPRPSADTPNGSVLGAKTLYLDLCVPTCPARKPTAAFRWRATSPVPPPHESDGMPKHLRAGGLTQNLCSTTSPRTPQKNHVTLRTGVSSPILHLELEKITRHQSVRGRGGFVAVIDESHWMGLSRPSWERELDL